MGKWTDKFVMLNVMFQKDTWDPGHEKVVWGGIEKEGKPGGFAENVICWVSMQVPEDEYFEGEQNQSEGYSVENSFEETGENAAEAEEKLAKEKEEELKAEKEKREEALKRIEAKEAERRKEGDEK